MKRLPLERLVLEHLRLGGYVLTLATTDPLFAAEEEEEEEEVESDQPSSAMVETLLHEYRAVLKKVESAAAVIVERRRGDVACTRGCADCCAAGLSVLPVEAFAIEQHLQEQSQGQKEAGSELAPARKGSCSFLSQAGACMIYEARPLLCRTHGLPIRMPGAGGRGQLPVLDDDTWACALNFTQAAPKKEDVMCGLTLMALLATVDARFREHADLPAGEDRVALSDIRAAFS